MKTLFQYGCIPVTSQRGVVARVHDTRHMFLMDFYRAGCFTATGCATEFSLQGVDGTFLLDQDPNFRYRLEPGEPVVVYSTDLEKRKADAESIDIRFLLARWGFKPENLFTKGSPGYGEFAEPLKSPFEEDFPFLSKQPSYPKIIESLGRQPRHPFDFNALPDSAGTDRPWHYSERPEDKYFRIIRNEPELQDLNPCSPERERTDLNSFLEEEYGLGKKEIPSKETFSDVDVIKARLRARALLTAMASQASLEDIAKSSARHVVQGMQVLDGNGDVKLEGVYAPGFEFR